MRFSRYAVSLNKVVRAAGLGLAIMCWVSPGFGQGRVNDKDVEALMRNLKDDAKSFRSAFNSAIGKSVIRKTSREKEGKQLVQRFQNQTEAMLNNFKRTKKGEADLRLVLDTAQQVERVISEAQLSGQATAMWTKIRTELDQISGAFGLGPMSSAMPLQQAASGSTCVEGVGAERAKRLVDECLQVSPATHPPCNAQNTCALIIDEIKRGCGLLGRDAPAFCNEYR